MLQEVVIFADRTSITEEIVRLKSHIKQFKLIIDADQPVGRKLDFLIQEFNREANTIASKANDYTLAQVVVEIKAEIEKSGNRSRISSNGERVKVWISN